MDFCNPCARAVTFREAEDFNLDPLHAKCAPMAYFRALHVTEPLEVRSRAGRLDVSRCGVVSDGHARRNHAMLLSFCRALACAVQRGRGPWVLGRGWVG